MIRFQGTVVISTTVQRLSRAMRNAVADGANPTDVVLDLLDRCPDRELPALVVSLLGHTSGSGGPRPKPFVMSDEERRDAHARYRQGHRDATTRLGEREYQRAYKRRARDRRAL